MTTTVTWFPDVTQARSAVLDLVTGGVPRDDISVLIPPADPGAETTDVPPFAASLMDAQSLTVPGIGAVAAAGPLAKMLATAATDGGGDLQSVIAATGAPANQITSVLAKLKNGGALLAVQNNPAFDVIVQGVLRHTLDADTPADAEQVGPAPDDEAVEAQAGGPVSRSLGAMTGGVVPGSWGTADPLRDDATPELERDTDANERNL